MTNQRNNLIILGLMVILIGAAAYFIFVRQPVAEATRLGLDLEGGVSANLQGYKTDGSEVTREEMDLAASVIRQRIDSLGVTEPEIQVQGQDQVVANIPGLTDTDQAIDVIGRTAQLGFYDVLAASRPQVVTTGDDTSQAKEDLRSELQDDPAYEDGTKILLEERAAPTGQEGTVVQGYIVPEEPSLTGKALKGATLTRDSANRREVQMNFTSEGAQEFGDLSQKVMDNALANGTPGRGQLAIVLDEDVVSAPVVENSMYGGQISINNRSNPEGLPQKEAQRLEVVLKTGALPINMEVLSVTSIGPTLGSDSLRSGLLAALVGFGLVLVFLVVIYRVLGLIADLALLIYAFLLWGLIVTIPITMTLPGIAGIVLSIGVAADANVVIFERIKEEIRRGKSPRTAVQLGYQKGFAAILDGNLTTLITAMILFALSSGSVRGFAVLLAIGVVLSMFTAISVTRALLGVISGRGIQLSPGMAGVSKKSITEGRTPRAGKAGAGAR